MSLLYSLDPRARQAGYRVEAGSCVSSTSLLALARAKNNDSGLLWIVAQEQTQGTARRGRVWHSPPGNLYASLLLVADYEPEQAAGLGFVAGVALVEALASFATSLGRQIKIALKWPNDVLMEGKKLTGILVERQLLLMGGACVVIGIGTNVANIPQQMEGEVAEEGRRHYAATSLRDHGFDITPEMLFTSLSYYWLHNVSLWDEGRGFGSIREKWLMRAAGIGSEIHVRMGTQTLSGVFETVDDRGQLMIRTGAGDLVYVSAGDVYFGDAATLHC